MSWLSRIFDAFATNPASSVRFDPSQHIRQIVMTCGLTKERPEDVDFYVAAYESRRLNPRDVRRFGTLLTSEEKEELGIAGRAILAREFIATLNDSGLADPEAAALMIAQPAAQRCRSAADLLKMRQGGIELARFRASSLAAGPCRHAVALDGARMAIDNAKLLPFDDCERPEQCACNYQAWQNLADEMDDVMI